MSVENNEINRYGCYRFGSICPNLPIENNLKRVYTKTFYQRSFSEYTLMGVDKETVCLGDHVFSKFQFVSEIEGSDFNSVTNVDAVDTAAKNISNFTDATTSPSHAFASTTTSSFHSSSASGTSEKLSFLVLTVREKTEILTFCFLSPVKITVLEEAFPFLSGIRYVEDSKINYENLRRYMEKVRSMKLDIDYFHSVYTSLHKKISRKLPFKSSYDNAFFYHPVFPYQEVFKFRENRKDRIVVALDFNSMYASVMDGLFPHPKYLEKNDVNSFFSSNVNLQKGIYLVSLSEPDSFISRFHAVRYVEQLKNYPFVIKPYDTVETVLSDEEITFYSKHFGKIYIHYGYSSKLTVRHPLLRNRNSLYSSRLHYKR